MTDGMGSAWVPLKRKRPSGDVGLIKYFTDLLAGQRGGTNSEKSKGYYDALDDLRALVGLEATDRSRREE